MSRSQRTRGEILRDVGNLHAKWAERHEATVEWLAEEPEASVDAGASASQERELQDALAPLLAELATLAETN